MVWECLLLRSTCCIYRIKNCKADPYVVIISLYSTVCILQYYSYRFIHAYIGINSLCITVLFIHTFYADTAYVLQCMHDLRRVGHSCTHTVCGCVVVLLGVEWNLFIGTGHLSRALSAVVPTRESCAPMYLWKLETSLHAGQPTVSQGCPL